MKDVDSDDSDEYMQTLAVQLTTVMKHCVTLYKGRWLCPDDLSL